MGKSYQTIKMVLHSVQKQQVFDEGLHTALCNVEAIVNDCPITTISDDGNDPEPLTPTHLLWLKGKPILPHGLYEKQSRQRWRQHQYICDFSG